MGEEATESYSEDDLYENVAVAPAFTEKERQCFQDFQSRGAALFENYQDFITQLGGFEVRSMLSHEGTVRSEGPQFNPFRFKGLLVDYRFFVAQKEPTHFTTLLNFVRSRLVETRAKDYLVLERRAWLDAEYLYRWHGIKTDEVVMSFFNGRVFHGDRNHLLKLSQLQSKLDEYTLNTIVLLTLLDRVMAILRVSQYLAPAISSGSGIRLPVGYEDGADSVITIQGSSVAHP